MVLANIYVTYFRYKLHVPFLRTNGIVSVQAKRIGPLYKHVFPPQLAPRLSFVGIPEKVWLSIIHTYFNHLKFISVTYNFPNIDHCIYNHGVSVKMDSTSIVKKGFFSIRKRYVEWRWKILRRNERERAFGRVNSSWTSGSSLICFLFLCSL